MNEIIVDKANEKYHSDGNCLIKTKIKRIISGCNKSIIPDDGSVTNIGWSSFSCLSNLKTIIIPEGVTTIGTKAFAGCANLTKITIPNSITEIEGYAFSDCKKLTSVTLSKNLKSIGKAVFGNCINLKELVVDKANTTYYSDGNCIIETETKKLVIGCDNSLIPDDGSVTEIGEFAFRGCENLTEIVIPEGVKIINKCAFSLCYGLTKVIISDGVMTIGEHAFALCTNLTSIILPNSITEIGDTAFIHCKKLNSIIIPASVTNIDNSIFIGCKSLNKITVEKDNEVYHNEGNCIIETKTKKLILTVGNSIIPDDGSVTEIGACSFIDNENIRSITIPKGIDKIGKYAFSGCNNLTEVIISNSVTEIGDSAFSECELLSNITYNGTINEWKSIKFGDEWAYGIPADVVHCSDGDVKIDINLVED